MSAAEISQQPMPKADSETLAKMLQYSETPERAASSLDALVLLIAWSQVEVLLDLLYPAPKGRTSLAAADDVQGLAFIDLV